MGVLQLLLCTTILLNLKDEIDNVMKKRIMNTVPFHYLYICLHILALPALGQAVHFVLCI